MALLNGEALQQACAAVRLLILDVDGVLTDGRLYYGPEGEALKVFNTLDGHGLKMLQKSGVAVAVITGRKSASLQRRLQDLGIDWVIQGREDKYTALQELLAARVQAQLPPLALSEMAFMGDDYPDLSVMLRVGLALAPPNACEAVLTRAHWVSQRFGGLGAVREACDLIMQAQGTFDAALGAYLP